MTDILPPAGWPNVRQLETNEFATGGANGNMNEQAKSLAARSELLKQYAALPYESKMGGYALNERVQLATGDIVRSTIPSNVNNPNENMTGWVNVAAWSNIKNKPTTVAGYGITDAYTKTEVNTAIANATPTIPNATETTAGKAKIATTAIAKAGVNDTDIITAKKLRDALNASDVLPVYGLRSWGIIKGTTTPASLGRGVNVASIVDEGVGQYKVTFITAMPNTDYVILMGATSYSTTDLGNYGAVKMGSKTVNGFSIVCGAQNYADIPEIYFGVTY